MGVYLIQSTDNLMDSCVEDAIIVAPNKKMAIQQFRKELKFQNERKGDPGFQIYRPDYFETIRLDKSDRAIFIRYADNAGFTNVSDDYNPFLSLRYKPKAYQLFMDNTDTMSIAWGSTVSEAKSKFNEVGSGKSSWYMHDLSSFGGYTDVRAIRLAKLDNFEHAEPEQIIKILVKEYGWQSDVINKSNVDEIMKKPSEEWG